MSRARRPGAFLALLTRASEALSNSDREGAALCLREAWRDSRCPSLARAYELVVRPAFDVGLGEDSNDRDRDRDDARAQAFRALATRDPGAPLDLASLLADLHNPALPELERLRLLRPWTPDPLLAAALAARLRLPLVPESAVARHALRVETIRLLAAQRDPRQLATLEALAREPGLSGETRRQLRGALASLEQIRVRALDERARAALAPLERRLDARRARDARGAALLAAVLAAPSEDAPRLVYADWLSERGDPRGEFITLQISRARATEPATPSARERALVHRHARRWVAPLHAALNPHSLVFERGFLAVASIEAAQLRGEILTSDTWRTLRMLDGHVPDVLVLGGCVEALDTLYGFLDLERFVALRADGQLQGVTRYECSLADPNLRFDTPLGLRALLVRRALDERLVTLLRSPACRGLEEFAVYYELDPTRAPADHRERPHLRGRYELLADALPGHVRRLRMLDARTSRASRPQHVELLFERDEDERLSRLMLIAHPCEAGDGDDVVVSFEHVLEALAGFEASAIDLIVDSALERVRTPLRLRFRLFERSG